MTLVQWSFGDGIFLNSSGPSALSRSHSYAAGAFTARVVVWEGSLQATAVAWIRAGTGLLEVQASSGPANPPALSIVTLTSVVSAGSGSYLGTAWTFGDGGGAVGGNVNHEYSLAGLYVAQVTVADDQGRSANASVLVDVAAPIDLLLPGPSPPLWEVYGVAAGLGGAAFVAILLYRRGRAPSEPPPGVYEGPAPEVVAEVLPPEPVPPVPGDGTRTEPPPSPAPAQPPTDSRSISREIVLHLYRLGRVLPDELATSSRTQRGLGEELGVPQNVLSNVVRRLEAAGVLTSRVEHVQGRDRRVKVYYLTTAGERLARSLTRAAPPPPG